MDLFISDLHSDLTLRQRQTNNVWKITIEDDDTGNTMLLHLLVQLMIPSKSILYVHG